MGKVASNWSTVTRHRILLPGRVPMHFRRIPRGEFLMGQRGLSAREEPVHRVVIQEDFWMGETPVTQAQFEVWTKAEGIEHRNDFAGRADHPAENMSWHEAVGFCEWLTRTRAGEFPEGFVQARLPSEAEWEYACRAGTETDYYSGDGEAALAEVGWYDGNSEQTQPVGRKDPNAWGLRDMHGNVWEWCADVFDPRAYRKRKCEQVGKDGPVCWLAHEWTVDDAGADAEYWRDEDKKQRSPVRVLRGGAWGVTAGGCRSAFRGGFRPSGRGWSGGFRVCLARKSAGEQEKKRKAEPAPGGVARRDDEAKPDGAGGAGRGKIDLARERLPGKPK
jgi:formylglycine-generating enzyme required for sulfatase activity